MAKTKKAWFCRECGNESPKWMGKCPACGEWNTMVEEVVSKQPESSITSQNRAFLSAANPLPNRLRRLIQAVKAAFHSATANLTGFSEAALLRVPSFSLAASRE